MSCNVNPNDFEELLITPESDKCEGFTKALIQLPAKLRQLVKCIFDNSGNPTQAFKRGILPPGTAIQSFADLDEEDNHVLFCDGRAVARIGTYAALFAAIGTDFGVGDGSTTFNIPNVQNRYLVCTGSDYALTTTPAGNKQFTITQANLPNINLTVNGANLDAGLNSDKTPNKIIIDDDWDTLETASISLGGSGTAIDNRPPWHPCKTFIAY